MSDTVLAFTDAADVIDLDTFVGRAKSLDPTGAIRLSADGTTLALTVCVLPGSGLSGEGTVTALRAMRLAEPARLDAVVGLDAMADRLARMRRDGSTRLAVPPVPRVEPWAGVSAPRSGWVVVGELDPSDLIAVATDGIARVAEGSPTGSGAAAVADLRRRVWSAPTPTEPSIPAGVAFAAYGLGLLSRQAPVEVRRLGGWVRVTTPAGHVIARVGSGGV